MERRDIRNFSLDELKEVMTKVSQPSYRAEQIFFWIYAPPADSLREEKNRRRK